MAVEFVTNQDGSVIVKLGSPVQVDGEPVERLTIPRLKGKHLFGAPPLNSVGKFLEWGSTFVEPKGALEELEPLDAIEVGDFLFGALRKPQKTGEPA